MNKLSKKEMNKILYERKSFIIGTKSVGVCACVCVCVCRLCILIIEIQYSESRIYTADYMYWYVLIIQRTNQGDIHFLTLNTSIT